MNKLTSKELKNKVKDVYDYIVNTYGEQQGINYLDSVHSAIKHYKYHANVRQLPYIEFINVVSGGKVSPR